MIQIRTPSVAAMLLDYLRANFRWTFLLGTILSFPLFHHSTHCAAMSPAMTTAKIAQKQESSSRSFMFASPLQTECSIARKRPSKAPDLAQVHFSPSPLGKPGKDTSAGVVPRFGASKRKPYKPIPRSIYSP